jgi:hypothetical protein
MPEELYERKTEWVRMVEEMDTSGQGGSRTSSKLEPGRERGWKEGRPSSLLGRLGVDWKASYQMRHQPMLFHQGVDLELEVLFTTLV